MTHFHGDHMGGAPQLAERLPISNAIDHGSAVDEGERRLAAFRVYTAVHSGTHPVVAPGDRLPVDHLDIVIVASGGAVLDGAGGANPHCEGFTFRGKDITSRYGNAEDDQSVKNLRRLCHLSQRHHGQPELEQGALFDVPGPQIGPDRPVPGLAPRLGDLRSDAVVQAIAPRAAIINNGPRKDGAVQAFEILTAAANPPDLRHNRRTAGTVSAGPPGRRSRSTIHSQSRRRSDDQHHRAEEMGGMSRG
ncbi:MAG: MBL fold metallo-hydrolase [Gammaproteobacteria bacterium]|nr:MBL fold metallo-hydrolase [Gammaproteobacteria bacterium]